MNTLRFNTSDGCFYLNSVNIGDYIEATILEPMYTGVTPTKGGYSKTYCGQLLLTFWCQDADPMEVVFIVYSSLAAEAFEKCRTGDKVTIVSGVVKHRNMLLRTLVVR